MEKIAVLIQTGKDRLRYLDTTFNSIKKAIPSSIDIYIAPNNAEQNIIKYLTTNETISLDNQYLFPNENKSWRNSIGEIPNKTHVVGIANKFKEIIQVNETKHRYEFICQILEKTLSRSSADYIVFIEDDVIFKETFFEEVLKCIKKCTDKVGRISVYKGGSWARRGENENDNTIEKVSGWPGPNICIILNRVVLNAMNLKEYKFNIDSLPDQFQKVFLETGVIPQAGGDDFLSNYIKKYADLYKYTGKGVCQHIGVLSSIYTNVTPTELWYGPHPIRRCFFDSKNNLRRIDLSCKPPYLI